MDRETLEFRIDAYTPETLPLTRLAEYLAQLATLLGSRETVHFGRLKKGSAVMEAWFPETEASAVIRRIKEAPTPRAPEDARRAYLKLDAMLRENNAVGEIKRKGGGKVLTFPGRKLPDTKPMIVAEYGEVDGVIIRVGGKDATIPVHLETPSGDTLACEVRDRAKARELAQLIFADPVRLRGRGEWERTADGEWKLINMLIDAWEILDLTPADEIFNQLRAVRGNGWIGVEDVGAELRRIRDGE